MSIPKCPYCDRTGFIYLSKCKTCGSIFCDNCMEAASKLAGGIDIESSSVSMYSLICPNCSSQDVEAGIEQ